MKHLWTGLSVEHVESVHSGTFPCTGWNNYEISLIHIFWRPHGTHWGSPGNPSATVWKPLFWATTVMTSNLVITDASLQRSHWHHQQALHNAACWLYPAVGANYLLDVGSHYCGVRLGCGVSSPKSSHNGGLGPPRVLKNVFGGPMRNPLMASPEKLTTIISLLRNDHNNIQGRVLSFGCTPPSSAYNSNDNYPHNHHRNQQWFNCCCVYCEAESKYIWQKEKEQSLF